jgi:hypothetical protein
MKKLVSVQEVENEGMVGLLGEEITVFCANYIYAGKLIGVNESFVKLSGAKIVYETGELTTKTWKDAQALPRDWYIQVGAIESFGLLK